VLAIGADQPDFFGPNLFVDSMVFGGDVIFLSVISLQPPGTIEPGGYGKKS
jgi:hypothetical protein